MSQAEPEPVVTPLSTATPDSSPKLVQAHMAAVATIDMRSRLGKAVARKLPGTLLFDHPTPRALAHYLSEGVGQVEAAESADQPTRSRDREPIAVVGVGRRLPSGVRCAADLRDLLAAGRDATGDFPTDRNRDLDAPYDPDPAAVGTSYTRRGGLLDGAGDFDARFFHISPREAQAIDPQQRLLLETSWEALEKAGIDPTSLRETRTAVFIGRMDQGFGAAMDREFPHLAPFALTGKAASVASGRISYVLGLRGPSVTVDTACSSSLVAIRLACQSLRTRECEIAPAGGATVMASPTAFVEFSRQRGLSPDGRRKAFCATAGGTGRAEGAGVVALMRLSDALHAGHPVLAVISGTARCREPCTWSSPRPRSIRRTHPCAYSPRRYRGHEAPDLAAPGFRPSASAVPTPTSSSRNLRRWPPWPPGHRPPRPRSCAPCPP